MFQKPTKESLDNRFNHHPPFGDQAERYGEIRRTIRDACYRCVELTPVSSEQTRAVNAMHEAMMLFNSAIACNEKEG